MISCAHVKIPDTEFCGDAGAGGADCFHTLSEKERSLSKKEWDRVRFGQVCTPAASYASWKTALLQLCEASGRCDFEVEPKPREKEKTE